MPVERNILGLIRNEKQEFLYGNAQLAPGYFFNQLTTIKRIENYFNSRFDSGPYDEDGWPKPFFNVVRKPVQVCAKEIDLDTKDILIRSEDGDYITAELMAADFKQWMKDEGFAKDLNEYADLAPEYGTVVIKKVKKRLRTLDLKRLIISNVAAENLSKTNIIETHEYTPDELRQQGWPTKEVEELIALHERIQKPFIEVDERYGWVSEDLLTPKGDPNKLVYTLCLAGGTSLVEEKPGQSPEQSQLIEQGIVLEHKTIASHPYREWHFSKMKNRWLGVGLVEVLFDAQVHINEVAYFKAKALHWTGLHLFQSDDETVSRNLLNDVKNGDVVKTQKDRSISVIPVEERNLAHYHSEEQRYDRLVADLTFTPDVITGEGLPSGTPARSAMISDANVKRFFDRKREDFGIFLRQVIIDDILPQFKTQKSKGHTLSVATKGVERDRLEEIIFNAKMNGHFAKFVKVQNRLPTSAEWTRLTMVERQKLARRPTLEMLIPDGAYDDIKDKIDVVITKENEDTDSKIQGRQVVLQALAANPNIALSPMTRPLFLELAELLGIKHAHIPSTSGMMAAPQGPTMPAGSPQPRPAANQVPA